ncbi:hypothetical protein BC938DRAFT_478732 [Jimgerdemannia flammicorona]|uniref:Uncharacterized protein n=1 Tax=Jimgerdemannia flammicorona TaxID=994334 RepID=A0A433QMC7_9FUNG|nr:hypothetical protein BC938DRAFT_478732 [Jimgerdemannia flammicorona]
MQELAPLLLILLVPVLLLIEVIAFWNFCVHKSVAQFWGTVDELQYLGAEDRPTSDDACASRQEVSPHNVFEHGTLATGLRANNNDLRQINRILHPDGREGILKFVDCFPTTNFKSTSRPLVKVGQIGGSRSSGEYAAQTSLHRDVTDIRHGNLAVGSRALLALGSIPQNKIILVGRILPR